MDGLSTAVQGRVLTGTDLEGLNPNGKMKLMNRIKTLTAFSRHAVTG